eukprot:1145339-Pelagomonas_calceolata.AAC.3
MLSFIPSPHSSAYINDMGRDVNEGVRAVTGDGKRKEKFTPAKRLHALRKGSLTSKLARVSPKGPQT